MLTKEDLDLAERHERDLATVKAKTLELRQLDEDEKVRVKKHAEHVRAERKGLHKLHLAAKASGAAVRKLVLAVPAELRDAIGKAEADLREYHETQRAAAREVKNLTDTLAKFKEKGVDKAKIEATAEAITKAKAALAESTATEKALVAKVAEAKKAARAALEGAKAEVAKPAEKPEGEKSKAKK
jgi:hypothetical protein